ncbi:MAG: hypothetical protein ACOCY8_06765, partial [Spirochaetota bacterium]
MIRRFHGIDRHKKYSTVSVLDRDGKEVRFHRSCAIEDYLSNLGAEDAVVGRQTAPRPPAVASTGLIGSRRAER